MVKAIAGLLLIGAGAFLFYYIENQPEHSDSKNQATNYIEKPRAFDSDSFDREVNDQLKFANRIAREQALTKIQSSFPVEPGSERVEINNAADGSLSFEGSQVNETITEHLSKELKSPSSLEDSIYQDRYSDDLNRIDPEVYRQAYNRAYQDLAKQQGWLVQLDANGKVKSAKRLEGFKESIPETRSANISN